jgi:signal transduction histidine kinase
MSGIEFKVLSYIPAIVGVACVGLFVFMNNTKSAKNKFFALTSLLIVLWLTFLFIGDTTTSLPVALWALRFGLFFGQLVFLAFYLFALEFPFKTHPGMLARLVWSLPIIVSSVALLTPLGVQSVSIKDFGVQPEAIGPLYASSDLLGVAYLLVSIWVLYKNRRKASAQQRSQINLVLMGLTVAIAANVFSGIIVTLLRVDATYIWIGSFSLFIFSLFVAYAIIRHRLFDVRPVVARSFTYLLLIVALSVVYATLIFGITKFFLVETATSLVADAIYLFTALTMAFTFQPLRKLIDKLSNRIFYSDAYDPQVFLGELNGILATNIDLEKLTSKSSSVIMRNLKPAFVKFYLPKAQRFVLDEADPSHKVVQILRLEKGMLRRKVIETDSLLEKRDTRRLYMVLRENNTGVILRLVNTLNNGAEEIGYILIGYKKSGKPYGSQDIRLLEIVTNELAISIQNALQFYEIQRFNATLQDKVDEATRKLRRTNERLRLLDQTKDDFISMASHQLRTPLTSVKGYVSMVLDGDAGKVNDVQHKLLTQSFLSAQRMVYLISDLLNVSRLRTGKFVIEPVESKLDKVIEEEVEQLTETVKSRGLELEYHKPEHFPALMLDETKLRQVIMNFVDNAIYYTPSGGHIDVYLVDKPESVEFTVVDNGIGVPKHEQHHLFTKFFRAQNAKRARPDGTGLGIFMAKKVIVAQGGAVIFKSVQGKGSTFGFTFPKTKLLPAQQAKPEKPAKAPAKQA